MSFVRIFYVINMNEKRVSDELKYLVSTDIMSIVFEYIEKKYIDDVCLLCHYYLCFLNILNNVMIKIYVTNVILLFIVIIAKCLVRYILRYDVLKNSTYHI